MSRGSFGFGACALTWLVVAITPARAEVRLARTAGSSQPAVQVRPTSQGPWSPVGTVDASVLNPAGDVLGDGSPGWQSEDGSALVTWLRDGGTTLVVAGNAGNRWLAQRSVSTAESVGTPRPARTSVGEWVIAWQRVDPEPLVSIALAGPATGVTPPTTLDIGWLVDISTTGDTTAVQYIGPDGSLKLGLMSTVPEPDPMPIVVRRILTLAAGIVPMSATGVPEPLSVRPDLLSVPLTDGGTALIATWWESPRLLAFAEIVPDGDVLPTERVRARGGSSYSPALVNEAMRIVRDRD